MKRLKIKQGTRVWESVKESRIGGSEVFDIVRYYAKDDELYNCGIDAKKLKDELPFVSTWALYHKILNDGIYQKPLLDPSLSEYGLAMETYGLHIIQKDRNFKLRKGDVFASDKLIASLDISGVSESVDDRTFDYGTGKVPLGEHFVCEQKTVMPFKDHLPLKYIIQAQYQIMMTKYRFFILEIMMLDNDTPFERGKIVALANNTTKSKFIDYVKDRVKVQLIYFDNNEALAQLIKLCIDRFFKDVEERHEPTPYIDVDNVSNIITSIRNNSFYNPDLVKEFDLSKFVAAKLNADAVDVQKKQALQEIIEFSMSNNCSRFVSPDGYTASFSSNGRFLIKEPKEKKE